MNVSIYHCLCRFERLYNWYTRIWTCKHNHVLLKCVLRNNSLTGSSSYVFLISSLITILICIMCTTDLIKMCLQHWHISNYGVGLPCKNTMLERESHLFPALKKLYLIKERKSWACGDQLGLTCMQKWKWRDRVI